MDTLQKFHKKAFSLITIIGLSTLALFLWLQYTGQTSGTLNNWGSIALGLNFAVSAGICFKYYKKMGDRGGVSKAILYTGFANTLFAIGTFIWSYYNFVEKIDIPYPSVADVPYILMTLAYAGAVGSLLQIYRSSTKISSVFVAVFVFIALVLLMLLTVGKPEISGELPFWENFFNFAFAFSDSIYVGSGAALLIIAGGKIYKGIFVWVLGMFLITLADILFTYRAALDLVWNGDIADQMYVATAMIFTYAVILLAKIPERKHLNV